jgi:hypothetical protein
MSISILWMRGGPALRVRGVSLLFPTAQWSGVIGLTACLCIGGEKRLTVSKGGQHPASGRYGSRRISYRHCTGEAWLAKHGFALPRCPRRAQYPPCPASVFGGCALAAPHSQKSQPHRRCAPSEDGSWLPAFPCPLLWSGLSGHL